MIKKILTFSSIFFCYVIFAQFAFACDTIQDYISEGVGDNFLLSFAFRKIAEISTTVSEKTWDSFAKPLQGVIAVGAAVYVAVYTLKNVGSFSKQDVTAYLSNDKTGIIPLLTKAGVVMLLLTDDGNQFLYGNLIIPVVNTFMKIGLEFGSGGNISSVLGTPANNVGGLFASVISLVKSFNESTYQIVALGKELLCLAWRPDGIFSKEWTLLPIALLVYIVGWIICIGMAFSLLDILFRLGLGCMLLPLAVACGFSRFTSNYTKKTWELFVNVSFSFMMLGMVTGIVLNMLDVTLSGGSGFIRQLLNGFSPDEDQVEDFAEDLADDGVLKMFVLITMCCTIAFKLFGQVEDLASKVSGTKATGSAGKKTGQTLAKPAIAVAKQPLKFAKAAGEVAVKDANKYMKKKASRAAHNLQHTKLGRKIRQGYRTMKAFALNVARRYGGL